MTEPTTSLTPGPEATALGSNFPPAPASSAALPPRPAPAEPKKTVVPVSKRSKKGKKKTKNVGAPEVKAFAEEMVEYSYLANGQMPMDDQPMELDRSNCATGLTLSRDKLSVSGYKGYKTVRATHGAYFGTWYFEVIVNKLGDTGHCRIGVSTKKSDFNIPVGADQFGYSYRDLEGTKQHKGLREPYGSPFGEGDIIGVYLHLPDGGRSMEPGFDDLVRFKGSYYYREQIADDDKSAAARPLQGSALAFSVNGKSAGVAYSDVFEGTYYPAGSIYTLPEQKDGATVSFNFGPDFKYAAPAVEGCPEAKPWCDVVPANAERLKQRMAAKQEQQSHSQQSQTQSQQSQQSKQQQQQQWQWQQHRGCAKMMPEVMYDASLPESGL